MRSLKLLIVGLFLGLMPAIAGFDFYQGYRLRECSRNLSLRARQLADLNGEISTARSRLNRRRRDAVHIRALLFLSRTAESDDESMRGLSGVEFLTVNPKLNELYSRWFQSRLRLRFGAMYRELNLSPEQIDRFEALSVRQAMDKMDLEATLDNQGLDRNNPSASALFRRQVASFLSAIANDVSPVVAKRLEDLRRARPAELMIDNLASMAAVECPPMTGEQRERLVQLLANASASYRKGEAAEMGTVDWPRVYSEAASILSAPQLDTLRSGIQLFQVELLVRQFYAQKRKDAG